MVIRFILPFFLCFALMGAKTPKPAPATPAPVIPGPECAEVGKMAEHLMKGFKLGYLADAIDTNDRVHMWYINNTTGMWVELEVKDNLQACIVRAGYDWHFAAAR